MQTDGRRLSRRMRMLEESRKQPIEELLRSLYYEQGLTLAELEAELGVPAKTIGGWLVRLGINQRALAVKAAQELTA